MFVRLREWRPEAEEDTPLFCPSARRDGVGVRVEWCDFVVFTPAGLHVERIAADYDFWLKELYPKVISFLERHILHENLTGNLLRKSVECSTNTTQHAGSCVHEEFLPFEHCQSCVASHNGSSYTLPQTGRNGSKACTVIASLVAYRPH